MSIEQFTSLATEEDLLQIFNYRNIHDYFGLFTTTFFRVLHNAVPITPVHSLLLKFWNLVLPKVINLSAKAKDKVKPQRLAHLNELETERPLYSRRQSVEILQGCFHTVHFISMRSASEASSVVGSTKLLKNTMANFHR